MGITSRSVGGKVISRHWRCLAHSNRAADYVEHLHTETFPMLRRIPGFVDASILSRRISAGVEFLIVTRWESLSAIVQFSGPDPEVAVVPPRAAAMMIDHDERARHFEVIESSDGDA
jgi:heme-degrading monooxygenase HmoA